MTLHALCSWHNSHYIWNGIHRFCVITTTPLMVSDQLYVWHNTHLTYAILCTLHNIFHSLCFHTIVDITLHTLHSWHHTHCIWYHTHASYLWHHSHSKYDKTPTMFVTLNSVYKTSHMMNEWQHNERIWHDTQCICVIKPKWLMTSQPTYEWIHTHCMYDNLGTLYDIISTLFFLFVVDFVIYWNETAMVYMCSPSQYPLPPPSSPVPSRFSQCTRSERLSHASNLGWWSVSP